MSFGEYIPKNFGQPVNYLQDALLSGQVQGALQQKFDVNTAKLEELVSKVSSIPLLQEDAKKYLGDKVQGALNLVNANLKASAGRGLLSNSVTTELSRYITSAIDDKVKTHMKYAQDIQNFEAGVAKLKEKDPKSFNQNNYEYAKYQAGLNNYLSGNVDTKLGTLSYVPYAGDPIEKMTEKALKYKQLKGEQTVEIVDPNDPAKKTVRKINGLTSDEILKYIPGIIDTETEQQLVIDGWGEYKTNPAEAKKDFRDMLTTSIDRMNDEIAIQEATIKANVTKDKVEDATRQKNILESRRDSYTQNLNNIDNLSVDNIGYLLKKNQLVNTFSELAGARINETYEVNDVWKAKEDIAKAYRDDVRADRALALKEAEALQKGLKRTANGTYDQAIPLSDIALNPELNQVVPDLDVYGQVKKAYNDGYNTVVNNTTEAFKNLPEGDTKIGYIASMKKSGFDYNPKTDDFTLRKGVTASKADASIKAFYESRMDIESANGAQVEAEVVEADIQRRRIAKLLKEAEVKAQKNFVPRRVIVGYRKQQIPSSVKGIPQYQDVPVYGQATEPTTEDIGKNLKDIPESEYILQKNVITISGDSAQKVLKLVPSDALSGQKFSEKANITVKKNTEEGTLELTEYQGVDSKGNVKIAKAIVPIKGSALASQLELSIDDNERSLKASDFEKGKPIFASKEHRVYDGLKERKQISSTYKNIDSTIKDIELANGLKTFASKQDAIDMFSIILQQKGFSEQEAQNMSANIVDKVARKAVRADLVPMNSAWNLKINGETKEFTSDSINKEYFHAQQIFPAQFTLYELSKEISDEYATKETIKQTLK